MTKTAEKPYPLGATYLSSPYKGVPPSGRGDRSWQSATVTQNKVASSWFKLEIPISFFYNVSEFWQLVDTCPLENIPKKTLFVNLFDIWNAE